MLQSAMPQKNHYTALVFGEVTPSQIDGIIYLENYNWRIQSATTDYQLYAAAMETLFAGTEIETIFNSNESILSTVRFSEVNAYYTQLLNASRLSIYVAGNGASQLTDNFEHAFGKLRTTSISTKINESQPTFPNMTQYVRLKRIFTSDVSAANAGQRPAVLITTENFENGRP